MNQQDLFDVTVIGGGPAGLYAAFYSGLREMKTKLIEYQPVLGGKINVYPEKMIWDVGGIAPITGQQLIEQLVEQGLAFNPAVVLNEKIHSISRNREGIFLLKADSGNVHYSKTVIIAIGSGILLPKKLEIEGAERFEKTNIHYSITSLKRFKDKTVLISGGGNTAIDWANELKFIAKKVYIAYRKENLSGHEAHIAQLQNSRVHGFPKTKITKLFACENDERIKRVELTHQESGERTHLDIDDLIVNHGYDRDTSLIKNSDLTIDMEGEDFIAGNSHCETSVEGIYAAGDVLHYDGKLHLIAGCFQDAANAANQAKQYIEPTAEKIGMVSSHNQLFEKKNRKLIKEMFNE